MQPHPMQNYRPPATYPSRQPRRRSQGLRRSLLGCMITLGVLLTFTSTLCGAGTLAYVASPPETINILILGADVRPNEDEAAAQIARTDSIMILSINPRKETVSLLSVPRDVFIPVAGFGYLRANTVIRNAELQQSGTGYTTMMTNLENTFGIQIDHYLWISFEGFVSVIDALGGVTIDVPNRIVDNTYPTYDYGTMRIEFQAGEQHMDGETALIYARTRHGDSDYERAGRQQQVIEAALSKLFQPRGVAGWPAAWAAFWENVETDMGVGDIILVLPGVLLYGTNNLERLVIDRNYVRGVENGVAPDVDALRPWLTEHME